MEEFDFYDLQDLTIGFFERHTAEELGISNEELVSIREFRRPFDEEMVEYIKTLPDDYQQSFWEAERRIEEEFDKNYGIVR